jgi:hypothetical protein
MGFQRSLLTKALTPAPISPMVKAQVATWSPREAVVVEYPEQEANNPVTTPVTRPIQRPFAAFLFRPRLISSAEIEATGIRTGEPPSMARVRAFSSKLPTGPCSRPPAVLDVSLTRLPTANVGAFGSPPPRSDRS